MDWIRKYFNYIPDSLYFPIEHLQTIFRIFVKFSLQFSSDTSVYKAKVILPKHEPVRWDLNYSPKINLHRQEKNYCNVNLGMQSSTPLRADGYQYSVRNKPCSLQENSMSLDFGHKFIPRLISENLQKDMKTLTITSQTTYGQQSPLHTLLIINNEKWEIKRKNYLLHFVTEDTRKKAYYYNMIIIMIKV